jgi:hypothetical protein
MEPNVSKQSWYNFELPIFLRCPFRVLKLKTHLLLFPSFFYLVIFFSYISNLCSQACTILLRGPSMDLLKEVERNLQDAMNVVRNVMVNPKLVPGGGATEIALAVALNEKVRDETCSSVASSLAAATTFNHPMIKNAASIALNEDDFFSSDN